jgi:hypothetical protein
MKEKDEENRLILLCFLTSFFAFTWEIGEYWHIPILDGMMEL